MAFGQFAREKRPGFKIIVDDARSLLTRGEWENDLNDLHTAEMAGASGPDERFLLKLFSPEHPIPTGSPIRRYIQSVDGLLLTNQICGDGKGKLSPSDAGIVKEYGLALIGVEHCLSPAQAANAQSVLAKQKIPVHADTDTAAKFDALDIEKKLFFENPENVDSLLKVRNILFLTNTRNFTDKDILIESLAKTNYDMIVIEPFFRKSVPLTKQDIIEIQAKKIGARRLVYAVLNVAVAEDTRLYWDKTWKLGLPAWLRFQSKEIAGGVIVDYWNTSWKRILGVYFRSIMDLGFDGVVLQGVREHETFERIIPIN